MLGLLYHFVASKWLNQGSRSLSENREPTAEKSLWPIFPLIPVKYEELFASNGRKNGLKMPFPRYGFYSRTDS